MQLKNYIQNVTKSVKLTQSVTDFHVTSRRHISLKMRSITRQDWTPPILACSLHAHTQHATAKKYLKILKKIWWKCKF